MRKFFEHQQTLLLQNLFSRKLQGLILRYQPGKLRQEIDEKETSECYGHT